MDITEEKFCDHSDPDADGNYDYYYSGVIYHLREGNAGWTARTYDDEKENASFLASVAHKKTSRGWKAKESLFDKIPYDDPDFRQAVLALTSKDHERIDVLLTDGYTEVDLSKITLDQTSD